MRLPVTVALITIFLTSLAPPAHAQISQFNFEQGSLLTAAAGVNATSVSGAATLVTPGNGGGHGVAPNGSDINLTVPGAQYKINGFDISIDFLRKENNASFFTLGGLDIGITTGAIYAKFTLNNGGTDVPISLAHFLTVPSDNTNFHTYRFDYDNVSGVFRAWLDGTLVYTNTVGSVNEPLSWTGATNAVIGSGVDGSGATVAVIDNFIYNTPIPFTTLATHLISFDALNKDGAAQLDWSANTTDGDFNIQRSTDGSNFTSIGTVAAQPGDNTVDYHFTDNTPAPTNFYRLQMTGADGGTTYSPVRKLSFATTGLSIRCYPNPVTGYAKISLDNTAPETVRLSVFTLDGRMIRTGEIVAMPGQDLTLDLANAPRGMLLVSIQSGNGTQTSKIFKQ